MCKEEVERVKVANSYEYDVEFSGVSVRAGVMRGEDTRICPGCMDDKNVEIIQ